MKKRHVQFSLDEGVYNRVKSVLVKRGLTWQAAGEGLAESIMSESIDRLGIPLEEMAFNRQEFENKIQEKFVGAMREHAFVLLARKNKKTKWVAHKEFEVERLLLELGDVFDIRTKGRWDKKKAAIQAVEYYRDRLQSFANRAMNMFVRYYKEKPSKIISATDLLPQLEAVLALIRSTEE